MVDVVCNVLVFIKGGIKGVESEVVDGVVRRRLCNGVVGKDGGVKGEPVVYRMVVIRGGGLGGSWFTGVMGSR